jgi:hypothetical protein
LAPAPPRGGFGGWLLVQSPKSARTNAREGKIFFGQNLGKILKNFARVFGHRIYAFNARFSPKKVSHAGKHPFNNLSRVWV